MKPRLAAQFEGPELIDPADAKAFLTSVTTRRSRIVSMHDMEKAVLSADSALYKFFKAYYYRRARDYIFGMAQQIKPEDIQRLLDRYLGPGRRR